MDVTALVHSFCFRSVLGLREGMFTAAKDALTSATAKKFLSRRIARYGTVQDLRIDSRQKRLLVVCELLGEPGPITVEVVHYAIEQDESSAYLRPLSCRCDRPWITNLLEDYVQGERFELPAWAKAIL